MKHNKGKRQAAPTSAGKGRQLFSMVILFSMLLLAGAVVFAEEQASSSYAFIKKHVEANGANIQGKEFSFTVGDNNIILQEGGSEEFTAMPGTITITEANAAIDGYTWTPAATVSRTVENKGSGDSKIWVNAGGTLTISRPDTVGVSTYTVESSSSDNNFKATISIKAGNDSVSVSSNNNSSLAAGYYKVTEEKGKTQNGLLIKNQAEIQNEVFNITLKEGGRLTISDIPDGYDCFVDNTSKTPDKDGNVIIETSGSYTVYVVQKTENFSIIPEEDNAPVNEVSSFLAPIDDTEEEETTEASTSAPVVYSNNSGDFLDPPPMTAHANEDDTSSEDEDVMSPEYGSFTATLEYTITQSQSLPLMAGNLSITKIANEPNDDKKGYLVYCNSDSQTLTPGSTWEVGAVDGGEYSISENSAGFTLAASANLTLTEDNGNYKLSLKMFEDNSDIRTGDTITITNKYEKETGGGDEPDEKNGYYRYVHEYYLKKADGSFELEGTSKISSSGKRPLSSATYDQSKVDRVYTFNEKTYEYFEAAYGQYQNGIYTVASDWSSVKDTENGSQVIILKYFREETSGTLGSYKVIHEYYLDNKDGSDLVFEGRLPTTSVDDLPLNGETTYSASSVTKLPHFENREYSYTGAVYGTDTPNGDIPYTQDSGMSSVIATENGEQVIILRYVRSVDPVKETEPPKETPTPTPTPTLPDPSDPDSPEEVTIIEDGVPKTYKKLWDPVTEEWDYILEDEVPLGTVPRTGDSTSPLLLLCAMAFSFTGLVALTPRKRKEF